MRTPFRRRPVGARAKPGSRSQTYPAPVLGWVTNENLAESRGPSARVLDNAFPELQGVRFRGGAVKAATIG